VRILVTEANCNWQWSETNTDNWQLSLFRIKDKIHIFWSYLVHPWSAAVGCVCVCVCRWTLPWSAPSCCWRGRTTTCGSSRSSTTTPSATKPTRPTTSLCPSAIRWSATNCWPPKTSTCACSSSKSKNKEWGRRKRRRRRRSRRGKRKKKSRRMEWTKKKKVDGGWGSERLEWLRLKRDTS